MQSAGDSRQPAASAASVVVVGCGGNIGSHLVPHLGRMPGVRRVTLIDRDAYEERNLRSQDITPGDVGKPKAAVQARRLRRINPALGVTAIADSVENVPLGRLRADIVLAGLDGRAPRLYVSQACWRLGVPWIDSGVHADELLARINVYVPGAGQPCLECAWEERDYRMLEQTYPCDGDRSVVAPRPTNAPSSLGALAASLLALECQKLLSGQWEWVAVGRQVLINALARKHYVTSVRRSPTCRFDHHVWDIETLDRPLAGLTVGDLFELGRQSVGGDGALALHVESTLFVRRLTCTACGRVRTLFPRPLSRLRPADRRCAGCGAPMVAGGFDMIECLRPADLPGGMLARPLRSLGLRGGDVFTLTGAAGERHFEIGTREA
jgi:adenylyltransferase/sulfurtransferase